MELNTKTQRHKRLRTEWKYFVSLCLCVLLNTACQEKDSGKDYSLEQGNAVYYWRTDLRNGLSSSSIISIRCIAAISMW